LTDISIGDAWHPNYESEGRGYSIVISRTIIANDVLNSMNMEGQIHTERVSLEDALNMHSHMLDFKKRGAFIRIGWQKSLGRKVPEYGYIPDNLSFSRKLIEVVISMFFFTGKYNFIRWIITHIPISILGPVFNYLRIAWKNISKPSKRKGLQELSFSIIDHGNN
jgi:coenzyme F420 hydrogenase subunit beta